MLFNTKNITRVDLQALIDEQIFENRELEYKDYSFTGGKLQDKQKDKFMKEIAAFANTNGGTIIIGMQEDENRLPTKLCGAGMGMGDFDNWLSSFKQLVLSRIRPHLHGVDCVPVKIDDDNIAIVVSVPKSYARPHSFWDGNKDEFFMRHVNGIMYMDIDDLRKEFLYTNGLQDKIRDFKRARISLILANECVGDLGNLAKLVIHIIPEWSFELGNMVDLKQLEGNSSVHPLFGTGWRYRYNADGYCIFDSDSSTNLVKTYTQFFRSGIIEATEIRCISGYRDKEVYDWHSLQGGLMKAITDYGNLLKMLNVPLPWHISATLLNAQGYVTDTGWGNSAPIERNIVNSLEGVCTEEYSLQDASEQVLHSLSNAFGIA